MQIPLAIIVLVVVAIGAFIVLGPVQVELPDNGTVDGTLTIDGVLEDPNSYVDTEITVTGIVQKFRSFCTLMYCDEENPCCNTCGSGIALGGDTGMLDVRGTYEGREMGCSGNNCKMECWPEEGSTATLTGVLKESYGEIYLEVGE